MSELETKIRYNGEVIATLNPGDIASVNCKDDIMEDDITIEVGRSTVLNGVVRDYTVNAGESISAGDFVEFIHKFGEGLFHDKINVNFISNAYEQIGRQMTMVVLNEYEVLVTFVDNNDEQSGGDRDAKAAVLKLDPNTGSIIIGDAVTIDSVPYDSGIVAAKLASVMNGNVIYVANRYYANRVKFTALKIDDLTISVEWSAVWITPVTYYTLAESSFSVLDENRTLFTLTSDNQNCTESLGFIITTPNGSDFDCTQISLNTRDFIKMSDGRFVGIFTNTGYEYKLGVDIYAEENGVFTSVSENGMVYSSVSYGSSYYGNFSSVAVTNDEYVWIFQPVAYVSSSYRPYISVFKYEGTKATLVNEMPLTTGVYSNVVLNHTAFVAVDEKRVLLVYNANSNIDTPRYLCASMLTITNNEIVQGTPVTFAIFDPSTTGQYNYALTGEIYAVKLGPNSVLVIYLDSNARIRYQSFTIDNMTIIPDTNETRLLAKKATTNQTILGVAKTPGDEGDTIEVYQAQ